MKISRQQGTILITAVLVSLVVAGGTFYIVRSRSSKPAQTQTGAGTVVVPTAQPTLVPTPIFTTPQASQPGKPMLQALELVTNQAFAQDNNYIPNSWGVQKNRFIRTTSGDFFMVYNTAGSDSSNRTWHLMHKAPGGSWQDIKSGDAGAEPINILRGPNDEIHLFAWPGITGQLQHLVSTDLGKSFKSEMIPGGWNTDQEQGYSGSGTNAQGAIVFFQTGHDKPGIFNWTYYTPETGKWTFHKNTIDYRYTYAFFMPGPQNDLTIVAIRDVRRQELGYPPPSSTDFDYVFDVVKYFHIKDATQTDTPLQQTLVKQVTPQNRNDYDLTYLTDSYIDLSGRTHILYNNQYDGPHHAILQDGKVLKDVKIPNISNAAGQKMRIIQDASGHFYIITIDDDGSLIVDTANASDTDGTQMGTITKFNVGNNRGCNDNDDYCHSPTFTVPRNGHKLSDTIDGVYGNQGKEIYFRINLRSNGGGGEAALPSTTA
ncbi:MAG: hypothetical protein NVS2B12_18520 [Ktedonobacteraceae bacterium]